MNRYGPHAQSNNIHNWPQAVSLMADGAWFKFVDDVAMSRDAKAANDKIKVVGRFHRDHMQQFSLSVSETRNRARAFILSWLNPSFMEMAPYIDAVEDFNEYWAVSHTPEETAARILWVQTLLQIWETEILNDHPYLERIKWCLGNAAVGNDIPWQVALAATDAASGPHFIGYHAYVSIVSQDFVPQEPLEGPDRKNIRLARKAKPQYRENFRQGNEPYHIKSFTWEGLEDGKEYVISPIGLAAEYRNPASIVVPGERSPDEFIWGSGRILQADTHIYKPRGIEPRYIITEGGLVRDLNGQAWLQPNDGWNHEQVVNGDMGEYVRFMGEVSDLYRNWNYNNKDRLEGYVYFTSGAWDWEDFELNGPELQEIISRTAAFPVTPTYPEPPVDPDPEPEPDPEYLVNGLDISHWQGDFDGEISEENGNVFVIVKASDGFALHPNSADPLVAESFPGYTKEAALSNHYVGAYHFFQPSVSAARQALAFLRALEMVEQQNIPPVLDLEATVTVSKNAFQDMVLEWLNIVEDQTGKVPMLYTNVSFYDSWLSDPRFDRYPLWIANYDIHASMPSLPYRRHTWDIWQWTSEGNGGANGVASAYVDLNRFNGNIQEFLELYEENWLDPTPPPPPEPPIEIPCQIREQYDRVVHVINPRATAEQRQFVFDSVSGSLHTITFSYDDAGATPCINNTAVLWYLMEEEQDEYAQWFAEFYPNTTLAFVAVQGTVTADTKPPLNFIPWWNKVLLRLRR